MWPGICEPSQTALVLATYSPIWGARSLACAQLCRHAKSSCPDQCSQPLMTTANELRSGKTHRDENFPVASWIIHPRHRALILAFYNFVRTADDIADHATLAAQRQARLSRPARGRTIGPGRQPARGRQSARGAGAAFDAAAPCARCSDRVPDGRDQASLRELGRSDPLLPVFGDAGRTLHARRSRRDARRPGRPPTRSAPACRSTITCRTAPRTTRTSTASIFRAMRWRRPAHRSKNSPAGGRRRRCCNACIRLRHGPRLCSSKANRCVPK